MYTAYTTNTIQYIEIYLKTSCCVLADGLRIAISRYLYEFRHYMD